MRSKLYDALLKSPAMCGLKYVKKLVLGLIISKFILA